ncbi:hypothetical protein [Hyalangium rubrum]|uniref:Uncharacterized protein n=1 Tax=Hyalangium rubrum TaxID=3103134 RepID=A0ABU5H0G7_9BACT|nr:hypothetical protein [Hyalangium sp. s54d21]MDY7226937.1 hypothetical protein [Hyalangium sp. s54d21]
MLSLVVVLLTATPGQASLLSPVGAESRPSSVRLLAQATPPAGSEGRSAPGSVTSPPPLVNAPDARIRELTSQVEELNSRIRALDTDWPVGAVVMTYSGYVLSPLLVVGLPLLIIGAASTAEIAGTLTAIGAATTIVGGVGVVLLIAGIVTGINASSGARAERQELLRERTRLEDELRELKRRGDASVHRWNMERPAVALTVASLSF